MVAAILEGYSYHTSEITVSSLPGYYVLLIYQKSVFLRHYVCALSNKALIYYFIENNLTAVKLWPIKAQ